MLRDLHHLPLAREHSPTPATAQSRSARGSVCPAPSGQPAWSKLGKDIFCAPYSSKMRRKMGHVPGTDVQPQQARAEPWLRLPPRAALIPVGTEACLGRGGLQPNSSLEVFTCISETWKVHPAISAQSKEFLQSDNTFCGQLLGVQRKNLARAVQCKTLK